MVLELAIALPILVILVLAVVEFGLYFTRMQQVALASRAGAEAASQATALPSTDGAPVPVDVLSALDQQLQSSGISYCRVRLEHNVGGTQVELISPVTGACECEPKTKLTPPLPSGEYVRLTVCTELGQLMPNCLACFGFDVSDRVTGSTTILRYERTP